VSVFTDGAEVTEVLTAFLGAFLSSEDGARACESARALGDSARLSLRTIDPDAHVSVDFFAGTAAAGPIDDANVEITLHASDLHDLLLARLDPVQISRLYETDRLTFAGAATDLAALVVLAGALQPHYPATLRRLEREDLLDTPMPERHTVWTTGPDAPPKAVINSRRSWQRSRRAA
jgi:hypothetical protein